MTTDELKALALGYLTGADLIRWCAPQLLINQYNVDNDSLQNGCDQAVSEIISRLKTKYDLTAELQKRTTERDNLVVRIVAILSIRNILGNMQNISETILANFKWADKMILDIRNGQANLPLPAPPKNNNNCNTLQSNYELVGDSFKTLG